VKVERSECVLYHLTFNYIHRTILVNIGAQNALGGVSDFVRCFGVRRCKEIFFIIYRALSDTYDTAFDD
jgi:hypothetical protein